MESFFEKNHKNYKKMTQKRTPFIYGIWDFGEKNEKNDIFSKKLEKNHKF